jgi:D-3-phosphoglycerate dehydrogenase
MKKPILIFDFDSTIVSEESMELLAEESLAGLENKDALMEEIKKITDMGMNGEISLPESLSKRFAIINAHKKHIDPVISKLTNLISMSYLENKNYIRNNIDSVYIVSSGFLELIHPIGEILGIKKENIFANELLFSEDGSITGINSNNPLSGNLGKVKQVKSLNLTSPVVMIGDGYTDYEVRKYNAADHFIAYTEFKNREKVTKHADSTASSFDDILKFVAEKL